MKTAALSAFGLSILFALPLLSRIGAVYAPLMLLCIGAGIFYTGGKKPLGYLGLGDLMVFLFYGPVAVCCTALALLLYLPAQLLLLSLIPGFLSCALLCINNLRDADEDRLCGKMTLVARFGRGFGKGLYLFYLLGATLILLQWSVGACLALGALCIPPLAIVLKGGANLNRALGMTAGLLSLYTLYVCYALLYL